METCRLCGRERKWLDGHHIIPIQNEKVWRFPWNRKKILDKFGFGVDEEIAFICRACHRVVQQWLSDPTNLLLERVCDLCGQTILTGLDGEVAVQYEVDGKTCHYDSAEVQIEAFKKDSKRV